jgi:syntaxin-binding protein 5
MTKIYTLANVLGEWLVEAKPPTFTNESLANPLATFVIDPLTGNELSPTAESLQAAMRPGMDDAKTKDAHCLWIAASRRSIRCAINFNGERVSKVELEGDELSDVFYVTRHGNKIIVAITTTGDAIFYNVPFLEQITRIHLYVGVDP